MLFRSCIILSIEERKTADATVIEATEQIWFAKDLGPIKFRAWDKAGRVSEHDVVFVRVGPRKLGKDPREGG